MGNLIRSERATALANLSLTVYVNCFSYLISPGCGGHSYACWRFDGHFEASHSPHASPASLALSPIHRPEIASALFDYFLVYLLNSFKIPGTKSLLSPFLSLRLACVSALLMFCQIQLYVQFTHCRAVNFELRALCSRMCLESTV